MLNYFVSPFRFPANIAFFEQQTTTVISKNIFIAYWHRSITGISTQQKHDVCYSSLVIL